MSKNNYDPSFEFLPVQLISWKKKKKQKQPSSVLFMKLNQIFFLSITFNTSKICG